MSLWLVIILAAILFVPWSLIPGIRHRRYRRAIRDRIPAQTQWAAEFPDATSTVEEVLTIFCDVFLFDRRYRFHFRPGDKVAEVYQGTTGPVADELQMERLTWEIRKSFGVDLAGSYNQVEHSPQNVDHRR
jgi:hypothetical protein